LISVTSAPNKLAKREAERAEHDAAANKTLTPIYPANPGGVRTVIASGPAPSETTGVVASPEKVTETIPAGGNTGGKCDIEVCTSAYRSFRASDCSYQPFEGPRRACVAPRGAQTRNEPTSERLSRRMVHAAMSPAQTPQELRPRDNDAVDAPTDDDGGSVIFPHPSRGWFR
jgi:hypothetical protein